MDRQSIVDEMERVRDDFHRLVDTATTAELHRQTTAPNGPTTSCSSTCSSGT